MGYYDRDEPYYERVEARPTASSFTQFTAIFVRLVGVLLLLVGLWVSLKVIVEAWDLYRTPDHIERFATAIEKGSNLDKSLASLTTSRPSPRVDRDPSDTGALERRRLATRAEEGIPAPSPRLSYFLAWIIGILLLMLMGRLALAAVKTGGELALYDTEVKRFAKTLIREAGGSQPSSPQAGTSRPANRQL